MKERIRFRIHPAGAAMVGAALLFAPSHEVLAACLAILWHEGCHLLVMLLCGIRECRIEMTPFGGLADVRKLEELTPLRQAACSFAGVAGSLCGYALCRPWIELSPVWQALAQANLSLALFNCLPIWPLDGARTCVAFFSLMGLEKGIRKAFSILAVLTGMSLTALGLYGAWIGFINPTLLLSGPYLCYAARTGYVNEQIRSVCHSGGKLECGRVMPVKIYAAQNPDAQFGRLLGRFSSERYHLMVDTNDGKIRKIWTEDEMLHSVLQTSTIGRSCK